MFTLLALFVFGYVKGHFTGAKPLRSALQTVIVGGLAAAAALGLPAPFPDDAAPVIRRRYGTSGKTRPARSQRDCVAGLPEQCGIPST